MGKWKYPTFCDPMDCIAHGILQARIWEWVAFPVCILPTQGLNPGFLHCRQILCQLSHKGSPRILKWVAYPFFRGASWPRNWTRVSCIVGGFFINWAIREAQQEVRHKLVGTDTWRNAGAGCWSPSTGPGYNPLAKGRFLHVSKAAVSWQPGQW